MRLKSVILALAILIVPFNLVPQKAMADVGYYLINNNIEMIIDISIYSDISANSRILLPKTYYFKSLGTTTLINETSYSKIEYNGIVGVIPSTELAKSTKHSSVPASPYFTFNGLKSYQDATRYASIYFGTDIFSTTNQLLKENTELKYIAHAISANNKDDNPDMYFIESNSKFGFIFRDSTNTPFITITARPLDNNNNNETGTISPPPPQEKVETQNGNILKIILIVIICVLSVLIIFLLFKPTKHKSNHHNS